MKKAWIIACVLLLAMGIAGAVFLAIGIALPASGDIGTASTHNLDNIVSGLRRIGLASRGTREGCGGAGG